VGWVQSSMIYLLYCKNFCRCHNKKKYAYIKLSHATPYICEIIMHQFRKKFKWGASEAQCCVLISALPLTGWVNSCKSPLCALVSLCVNVSNSSSSGGGSSGSMDFIESCDN
jgi:hypothetical protein